jgi:hypothetical protein
MKTIDHNFMIRWRLGDPDTRLSNGARKIEIQHVRSNMNGSAGGVPILRGAESRPRLSRERLLSPVRMS